MTIDPVKVPQNVYVEDTIIGPVTLRHIFILLGGGGVSYACWSIVKALGFTNSIVQFLAWTPVILAAAFSFIKINGVSMFRLLLLWIEKNDKPDIRTWMPRTGFTINIKTLTPKHEKDAVELKRERSGTSNIGALSAVLDAGPETENDDGNDGGTTDGTAEPDAGMPRPVDPSRIQTNTTTGTQTVDTISQSVAEQPDEPDDPADILRDITPPA